MSYHKIEEAAKAAQQFFERQSGGHVQWRHLDPDARALWVTLIRVSRHAYDKAEEGDPGVGDPGPEDDEHLIWAVRNIDKNRVRRIVNELLHFENPSGTFQVVEHRRPDYLRGAPKYDVLFTNYSCGYLQAAWEGWDPDERITPQDG